MTILEKFNRKDLVQQVMSSVLNKKVYSDIEKIESSVRIVIDSLKLYHTTNENHLEVRVALRKLMGSSSPKNRIFFQNEIMDMHCFILNNCNTENFIKRSMMDTTYSKAI